MDLGQRGQSGCVDRPVDDGDQVEVAHPGDVIPGRQRPRDEQVRDPAERLQLVRQLPYGQR